MDEIVRKVMETAQGMHTKSESLHHQECIMTHESFSPISLHV
jgi:altronate dehydratase